LFCTGGCLQNVKHVVLTLKYKLDIISKLEEGSSAKHFSVMEWVKLFITLETVKKKQLTMQAV
jgi:hypothetical protein